MNREELLRMAAEILRQGNEKIAAANWDWVIHQQQGARVAGAIDFRKCPDGVWRMLLK